MYFFHCLFHLFALETTFMASRQKKTGICLEEILTDLRTSKVTPEEESGWEEFQQAGCLRYTGSLLILAQFLLKNYSNKNMKKNNKKRLTCIHQWTECLQEFQKYVLHNEMLSIQDGGVMEWALMLSQMLIFCLWKGRKWWWGRVRRGNKRDGGECGDKTDARQIIHPFFLSLFSLFSSVLSVNVMHCANLLFMNTGHLLTFCIWQFWGVQVKHIS